MKPTGLTAYLNGGRWKFHCPKCKSVLPAEEKGVVCPSCHPEIRAVAMKPIPGGLLRPVPDVELREETRQKARLAGEEYVPIFPVEKEQIEKITRLRSNVANINWEPGESLADLLTQNVAHGDPVPKPKGKP
jgi:hypothetical protein